MGSRVVMTGLGPVTSIGIGRKKSGYPIEPAMRIAAITLARVRITPCSCQFTTGGPSFG